MRIGFLGYPAVKEFLPHLHKQNNIELVGVYDEEIQPDQQIRHFDDFSHLIRESELLKMSIRKENQFRLAEEVIRMSKHLFLDVSFAGNFSPIHRISNLGKEASVKIHISKSDRFHPLYLQCKRLLNNPTYVAIEQHLSTNFCANKKDWFDLIFRNVDLLLDVCKGRIKRVTPIISQEQDSLHIHIHLLFHDGSAGNILLSSELQPSRNIRIFQSNQIWEINFTENRTHCLKSGIMDASWNFSPQENGYSFESEWNEFISELNKGETNLDSLDHSLSAADLTNLILRKIS